MNRLIYKIIMFCLFCFCFQNCHFSNSRNYSKNGTIGTLYEGGYWFDGEKFVARKRTFVVDKHFSDAPPDSIKETVDLTGKYIVPPFGEAHNHNTENSVLFTIEEVIENYLNIGVFYVKNPNILPRVRKAVESKVNNVNSIDVTFANGGLSVEGGHPYGMIQRNIRLNPNWTSEDGDGGFYHIIHSYEDFEKRWPGILESKPDFIKTYLLYSEEYEKRKRDTINYNGWKGLDPKLLPIIAKEVQKNGLTVSTHIETATDFHYAVKAGVNEINHMPGFRPQSGVQLSSYVIKKDDAKEASQKGITVVTTIERGVPDREDYANVENEEYNDLQTENLKTLKDAGVKIAVGCDYYRGYTLPEIKYIKHLGVFSNLELLKMWSEETPKTIFPKRKIAKLKPNYEASFLVLEKNPIEDFSAIENIAMRVKQGYRLDEVLN